MTPHGRSNNVRRLVVFVLLFTFWIVFSGHFDALHLGLGLTCSAIVAMLSYDLILPGPLSEGTLTTARRFLTYIPWLMYEVLVANLHVVYLVLRPQKIRPQIVRFRTGLKSDLARATLGNSITLTPGTITMDISDDEFFVHAVSDKAAASVVEGAMERRVARVFLEPENQAQPLPDSER
jgi:multicomponent Na+:H+ antiporter subunit E